MALQSSGQISLNDIHIEAGGSSGTLCSINDSDIRGLNAASGYTIPTGSGTAIDFGDFYGASSNSYAAFATWAATNYSQIISSLAIYPNGRVQASCTGSMWGSPANYDTTEDSDCRKWSYHSIQTQAAANYITSGSRYVVWVRGASKGYGASAAATVNGCTSTYYNPWYKNGNDCYYYDSNLSAYRKMTDGRNSFSNFSGP